MIAGTVNAVAITAQESCEASRKADLYRRAHEIAELVVIVRDSVSPGRAHNLVRAELTLQKIAVLANGGVA